MPLDIRRIRLYRPLRDLIRPGLADLVAEYLYARDNGRLRVPRLNSDGLLAPVRLPSESDFAPVRSVLHLLNSKTGMGARLSVTTFELRAMILGVRLTERLIRFKRLKPWRKDQKAAARRLLHKLEYQRRYSIDVYVRAHGQLAYDDLDRRWKEMLKVIRRDLVPSKSLLFGRKRSAKKGLAMMIGEASVLAASGLRMLGYRVPATDVIRKILTKRARTKGGVWSAVRNPDRLTAAWDLAAMVRDALPDLQRMPPPDTSAAPKERREASQTAKAIAPVPRRQTAPKPPKARQADDFMVFLAEVRATETCARWKDLTVLERADAIADLVSAAPKRKVAKWLGVDDKTVRNLLKVKTLPREYQKQLLRSTSLRRVFREAFDAETQQGLRMERDRETREHSSAVASAILDVLKQADLHPGNRATVATHLCRWLADVPSHRFEDVLPAWDIDRELDRTRPARAALLDPLTAMNFYMTWLTRAMPQLAPEKEIRDRVANAIAKYDFRATTISSVMA